MIAFVEKIAAGGPAMIPILGVSVLMFALSFLAVVRMKDRSNALIRIMEKGRFEEKDRSLRLTADRYISSLSGIETIDSDMRNQLTAGAARRLAKSRGILLCASAATLLGLLGTVTGMISSFQSIAFLGFTDIAEMADGVSEALVTTQSGLMVAVSGVILGRIVEMRKKAFESLMNDFLKEAVHFTEA